jgi:uncharacterized membrane protein
MATLVVIGYPDTTTAVKAMEEVERLRRGLDIDAEDLAAIIRSEDGRLRTITNQHTAGRGTVSGESWGRLFEVLFFVPFLGMAVDARMRATMDKVAKSGMDQQFQDQVRDMLKPGTSALFIVVDRVTPAEAIDALSRFEGSVLKTSLRGEVPRLDEGLQGGAPPAA